MRKIVAILVVFLLAVFSFYFFVNRKSKDVFLSKNERNQRSYFEIIPIEKYSLGKIPCLQIQVEDRSYIFELDSGFFGGLDASPNFIEKISDKQFSYNRTTCGIKGKEYSRSVYVIPKVKVGSSVFRNVFIQEGYSDEFNNDSVLFENGEDSLVREDGRIGWQLFSQSNLFLDLKNSRIAFSDSVETLREHGYFVESFTKTSLILDRGLAEIDTRTTSEKIRCVLDTGATWNIINRELENEGEDPEETLKFPTFKIGEDDFGPIAFHPVPINLPIQVDAMLGMEFFSEHVVFLDFKNSQAYFYKASAVVD